MNPLITINPIEAGVRQQMISVFKSAYRTEAGFACP